MSVIKTVCTPTMARLQLAPSASCDTNAVAPRALQISRVHRYGRGTAADDVAHVRNGIDEREHPGRDAGHRERSHETVLPDWPRRS
jgi:hypothetical protein